MGKSSSTKSSSVKSTSVESGILKSTLKTEKAASASKVSASKVSTPLRSSRTMKKQSSHMKSALKTEKHVPASDVRNPHETGPKAEKLASLSKFSDPKKSVLKKSGSSASLSSTGSGGNSIPLSEVRALRSIRSFSSASLGETTPKKHLSGMKMVMQKARSKDKRSQQLGRSKTAQFACFLKKGREQKVFAVVPP